MSPDPGFVPCRPRLDLDKALAGCAANAGDHFDDWHNHMRSRQFATSTVMARSIFRHQMEVNGKAGSTLSKVMGNSRTRTPVAL